MVLEIFDRDMEKASNEVTADEDMTSKNPYKFKDLPESHYANFDKYRQGFINLFDRKNKGKMIVKS